MLEELFNFRPSLRAIEEKLQQEQRLGSAKIVHFNFHMRLSTSIL